MAASSLGAIGCWAAGIDPFQFWLRSLLSCAWKIGSVSSVIHQSVLRSKILFWCSSCSSDPNFHCLVPLEVSWDAFFSTIDVTYRTFFMKFWIFSFGCLPLVLFLSPMIITAEASVISKACTYNLFNPIRSQVSEFGSKRWCWPGIEPEIFQAVVACSTDCAIVAWFSVFSIEKEAEER